MASSGSIAPYSVVVWEFLNDLNLWEVYEPAVADLLEMHSQTNPSSPLSLAPASPLLASLQVTLSSNADGVQRNIHSGTQRQIRRRLISSTDPGGVADGVFWQWRDDTRWRFYPTEVSQMMEAFLVRIRQQQQQQPQQQQQTPTPSSVIDTQSQFPRLPYLLDVVNCVQTRKDTRFQRQMRRRTDVRFRRDAGSQLLANGGGSQYVTNGAANANTTPIVAAPRFLLNAQNSTPSFVAPNSSLNLLGMGNPFSLPLGVYNWNPSQTQPTTAPATNATSSVNSTPASASTATASSSSSSTAPSATMPPKRRATSNVPPDSSTNGNDYSWRLRHPAPSKKQVRVNNVVSAGVSSSSSSTQNLMELFTTTVPVAEVQANLSDDDCNICMERLTSDSGFGDDASVGRLTKCQHAFHTCCLKAMMNSGDHLRCPSCKRDYGVRKGNCPAGHMTYYTTPSLNHVRGFPDAQATIVIQYHVPEGVQGDEHPHPGKRFYTQGFPRTAFLPDNPKGRLVLQLLIIAWERRLTFTVGTSATSGMDDNVVWNEIHHKTGAAGHAFPDPNYLDNVIAELVCQGVSTDDLQPAGDASSSSSKPKSPRLG